jgi:hypothetical protein
MENTINKTNFLLAKSPYRGHFTPQNLIFDANLQEFTQKIAYIAGLESNGTITPTQAYQQIHQLWQQLQSSAEDLGLTIDN